MTSRNTLLQRIATSTALVAALTIAPTGLAFAQTLHPSAITAGYASPSAATFVSNGTTVVSATPNCTHLSFTARSYIAKHSLNLCGVPSTSPGVHPAQKLDGTCGDSYIYLTRNSGGGGVAYVDYGFNSTVGDISWRDLYFNYTGTAKVGSHPDQDNMYDIKYDHVVKETLGSGTAYVKLYGTVETWWGLECDMKGPSDREYVL